MSNSFHHPHEAPSHPLSHSQPSRTLSSDETRSFLPPKNTPSLSSLPQGIIREHQLSDRSGSLHSLIIDPLTSPPLANCSSSVHDHPQYFTDPYYPTPSSVGHQSSRPLPHLPSSGDSYHNHNNAYFDPSASIIWNQNINHNSSKSSHNSHTNHNPSFHSYNNHSSQSIHPSNSLGQQLPAASPPHPVYHHSSPPPAPRPEFPTRDSSPSTSPLYSGSPTMFHPPQGANPSSSRPQFSKSLSENLLTDYSPPVSHNTVYQPQPISMMSSMEELKPSMVDGSSANMVSVAKESFEPAAKSFAALRSGTEQEPGRARLLRGYRRLALIALSGLLLIAVAIGIVVLVNQRREDHDSRTAGGGDGDVVSQSGLGSARNNTLEGDGADPFNTSSSVVGSDNGLRGGVNGYDSLVVFGASYCDNAHARPANLGFSLKPPPYFKGRWTNGYVWNEYLSQMLGPGGGRTTLVNYAFGSATVDNSISTASVPDLEQQVDAFLSDLTAQSPGAGPSQGKALVGIWVGINSVTKIWNAILGDQVRARTQGEAQGSLHEAQAHINATVDRLFAVVQNLIRDTAFRGPPPDLLMLPIPPAQLLLVNIRAAKGNGGALRTLASLNDLFNFRFLESLSNLQNRLAPDQRIFTVDIPTVWRQMIEQPASHDLAVVDQPCITKAGVCSNPSSYLFWDTLHPTTRVHQQLASRMRDVIRS